MAFSLLQVDWPLVWTPGSISLILFVTHLALLLCVHTATATSNGNFTQEAPFDIPSLAVCWERLRVQGPSALIEPRDQILFVSILLLAFEILDFISKNSGKWFHSKLIPVRGKHLDDLTTKDLVFIGISKAGTAPFVYFYLRFMYSYSNRLEWNLSDLSPMNTALALIALFVVYDFFYTIFHWLLHIKAIYGWIHKHHHVQKAPSRANVDAVNVHPIEFVVGEYNHLWALYLVTRVMKVHIITTILFLAVGGFLAGLNHTRFDVAIRLLGWTIYDSKVHDVHHRIPQSNYGQYIMLWDHFFGTFRPYNPDDRVNPESQLDPATGKTLGHASSDTKKAL